MSPEFAAWLAISRGPVCTRWRCYANFHRDVGPRPDWRCLLIRDNQSAEFSPHNCRWQVAARYRWRRPTARTH
jgi:hypothetical protein